MSCAVHPSLPRWLRRSLYSASQTCLSLDGRISSRMPLERKDGGLAGASAVRYVCAVILHYTASP
uniref:Secreted protein n=1 Tax=Mesocestoides corti TaxID=53468 RepID=A0A5K3G2P2_MESCO